MPVRMMIRVSCDQPGCDSEETIYGKSPAPVFDKGWGQDERGKVSCPWCLGKREIPVEAGEDDEVGCLCGLPIQWGPYDKKTLSHTAACECGRKYRLTWK